MILVSMSFPLFKPILNLILMSGIFTPIKQCWLHCCNFFLTLFVVLVDDICDFCLILFVATLKHFHWFIWNLSCINFVCCIEIYWIYLISFEKFVVFYKLQIVLELKGKTEVFQVSQCNEIICDAEKFFQFLSSFSVLLFKAELILFWRLK